jgi:hypothetical protein
MASLMNEEELRCWILRRLGAPFLKVELTDEHLADSIESARCWFAAKKGMKKSVVLQIQANTTEYTLPPEIDTVLDVAFTAPQLDLSQVFSTFAAIDANVPFDSYRSPGNLGVYSAFTQDLQYTEMAKRVLSSEADWRQEDRKLHIFPTPRSASHMLVFYKSTQVQISDLNERDHELFKRYALAMAKRDLGRVRSKYDSFPTAQGSATLDGDRLLGEAETEIAALDDELAQSSYPLGILVG